MSTTYTLTSIAQNETPAAHTEPEHLTAEEVVKQIAAFDGWIGALLNVYEHRQGWEPQLIDQFRAGSRCVSRTRFGLEHHVRGIGEPAWHTAVKGLSLVE